VNILKSNVLRANFFSASNSLFYFYLRMRPRSSLDEKILRFETKLSSKNLMGTAPQTSHEHSSISVETLKERGCAWRVLSGLWVFAGRQSVLQYWSPCVPNDNQGAAASRTPEAVSNAGYVMSHQTGFRANTLAESAATSNTMAASEAKLSGDTIL
jgi:hypothetical protein